MRLEYCELSRRSGKEFYMKTEQSVVILPTASCFQNFRIGILRDPFWNRLDSSLAAIIPDLENSLNSLSETDSAILVDPVAVPFAYRIDYQKSMNEH